MSELKFIVYDVQHGSCSHVITPANQHIIIDLGSKAETSICRYLKENYFRYGGTIDQLVLTHLHEDHIYDLPNLDTYGINPCILQRPRGAFPLSYKASDPNHYKRIVNKANELNEHYTGVVSDSESPVLFQNNGGVHFEFFAPPDNLCSDDPNSFSNIIVVSYGYFKIVITGDNPASILKEMLQNNIQLRQSIKDSTILVAPHHGRDGEYCEEFVSAVNPRLTVFSDGTKKYKTQDYSRNRYANRTRGVTWGGQSRYSQNGEEKSVPNGSKLSVGGKLYFKLKTAGGIIDPIEKVRVVWEVSNGGIGTHSSHQEIYFKGRAEDNNMFTFSRDLSYYGTHLLRCKISNARKGTITRIFKVVGV